MKTQDSWMLVLHDPRPGLEARVVVLRDLKELERIAARHEHDVAGGWFDLRLLPRKVGKKGGDNG
jgi:hypothetical protein